ncbi:15439_t:CDS:2, partial [Racocetra fulgida]
NQKSLQRSTERIKKVHHRENRKKSKESRTIGIIEKDHHWVNRKNPPLGESK